MVCTTTSGICQWWWAMGSSPRFLQTTQPPTIPVPISSTARAPPFHNWQTLALLDPFAICSDNGVGFAVDEVAPNHHFGIEGMRERAEMIGAIFEMTSQPGQGTTVILRWQRKQ